MKLSLNKKLIITFGLLLIFLVSISNSSSTIVNASSTNSPSLKITSAYYCDVDNDGFEDDIVAQAVITADEGAKVEYLIYKLLYPSGSTYTDTFNHYSTSPVVTYTITLTNAATENGWYTFEVDAYIIDSNGIVHLFDSFEFDPPGGSNDEPIGGGVTTDP